MGKFEKYLRLWVLLCIVAGVADDLSYDGADRFLFAAQCI